MTAENSMDEKIWLFVGGELPAYSGNLVENFGKKNDYVRKSKNRGKESVESGKIY